MMGRQDILAALQNVFRETFDDEAILVTEATTADDIEGWDSLNNVRLMIAAEQAFGIRMKASEISSLKNVGELMDLVSAKAA